MIGLALDSGGREAGRKLSPLFTEFHRLLESYCANTYSPGVNDFIVVLRASGEVADFEFEGLDALRRNKRKRLITIDIGIPEWRWKSMTEEQMREWLAEKVRAALQAFVDRLKKDGEEVDEERLFADYLRAADAFLNRHTN